MIQIAKRATGARFAKITMAFCCLLFAASTILLTGCPGQTASKPAPKDVQATHQSIADGENGPGGVRGFDVEE